MALAVASRSTSDVWEETIREGRKLESWRLRATLLHYVMRAAGRATPNGLWAGVAMEAPHRGEAPISVRSATREIFVKPDLDVFYELFTAAASAEHYRRAVYLRWNPTLTEIGDWEYVYAQCRGGVWVISRITDDGETERLKDVLCDAEHMDFDALGNKTAVSEETLHRLYSRYSVRAV